MATKLQVANSGLRRLEARGAEAGFDDLPAVGQEAIQLLSRLVEITRDPDFFLQMSPFLADVKDFLKRMPD